MSRTAKPRRDEARAGSLSGSPTHLLHRALQLALDLHGEASGPGAITQRQHTVLAAAGAGDGLTQNDLVRATGIDRSTLADLVARLLAKGLLERQRSATDARANTVRLSEAGRAALEGGDVAVAAADARLLGYLPGKKREAFVKALGALAAAADGVEPAAKTPRPAPKAPKKATREADAGTKATKAAKPPKAEKKKKRKKPKRA